VRRRIIHKRWTEGTDVLDSEIEESFLFGRGLIGTAIQLRTLEDWQRLWRQWRGVVMPKVLKHMPGTRPFACYVTGEIPARPVVVEPPMMNGYFKLYVPANNGTGTWHYDYPEPYQRNEAKYLFGLGVIDADEMKRHRAWRRRGNGPYRGPYALGDYTLEQGLYV
jgi:hypothetical protein